MFDTWPKWLPERLTSKEHFTTLGLYKINQPRSAGRQVEKPKLIFYTDKLRVKNNTDFKRKTQRYVCMYVCMKYAKGLSRLLAGK